LNCKRVKYAKEEKEEWGKEENKKEKNDDAMDCDG
jgi:hypothetical protein